MVHKNSLEHITITGYKSIKSIDLALTSLNVLIGANGAGKTNFISIFTLIQNIMNSTLGKYVAQQGGADALLHFGQKTTDRITIKLTFGANGYECTLAPTNTNALYFEDEKDFFHNKTIYNKPMYQKLGPGGHYETKLFNELGRPTTNIAKYVTKAMQSWQIYHFHDTSPSAKVKLPSDINDNIALQPHAENLAAFLYRLQETEPQSYNRIVASIRQVAPFFDNFILRPNPLNPHQINLEWKENGYPSPFLASYLSDGTLRFICLATLLLQPDLPATILIDEPELGLHPYAIVLLASLIRKAAKRTQIIVSTQSVPLINQFQPENIIVVDREETSSTFRHLDKSELDNWLDDYGLGDLWEKNVLGGRPRRPR